MATSTKTSEVQALTSEELERGLHVARTQRVAVFVVA